MRMVLKVLGVLAAVAALAVAALGFALSHSSPCGTVPALPPDGQPRMKAVVSRCYGSPEVLRLEEVARPAVADRGVLVRVHAASVNPLDYHSMRGSPYIMRMDAGFGTPKDIRTGVDYAGTVEAVGRDVTRFKVGDEVFGGARGAFGEYVSVREEGAIARKPAAVPFDQAAAVAIAGITALQALRDKGHIHAGDRVLINGASGGVGTFAVQIAKSFGAEVTGVCSARNAELVRSLGADHVIDYAKEDFASGSARYNLIVDNVGNHSLAAYARVLQPKGRVVIVGAAPGDWLGPIAAPLEALALSPFTGKFQPIIAQLGHDDLIILADLMQAGKLTPVIDRHFPLAQVPAAISYLESGHARGKVVIDVDTNR
jgi:NADPH:quinone reductase-like Zn-dependent oxidoreductase